MYDSDFKGTIPVGVYKLTKLTYLGVGDNQFHDAPIPNAISNLVNLKCEQRATTSTAEGLVRLSRCAW